MKHIEFIDAQMNNIKPEISLSLALPLPSQSPSAAAASEGGLRAEERGIRLIHLLLTCAKHASSGNLNRADDCLRQISDLASVTGDSMQRLAARFASALAVRLVKRWHGLYHALNHNHLHPRPRGRALFARTIPFVAIAYSIVTESLIRAMMDERSVHVVDLGSDPNLGPAILRAFSRAPTGPPSHLKLTCVNTSKIILADLGSSLAKEASSLDLPFQFNPIAIPVKDLTIDKLDLRPNESLAFISILTLHELLAEDDRVDAHFGGSDEKNNCIIRNCKPMTEFLTMLKSASPKFILLVEQEVDHNHTRLLDRFVEGLHYYSAVFDSIDARSGIGKEERLVLEEMLGMEIENIVACEGLEREERHERYDRWVVRFTGAGFKPARIWYEPREQVKQILKMNSGAGGATDGYRIVSERCSLMICWHERPLFAVSLWTC